MPNYTIDFLTSCSMPMVATSKEDALDKFNKSEYFSTGIVENIFLSEHQDEKENNSNA